ncbi:DEKNAAC100859 [Brettanomyces naardenensis]|uniref:DEKNAAC100859 n=1 Tax=Brettanomyces naardenensis TaxID=13370 RepID=A0A448YFT1_BRENA|nr:DEKNAAC100859 [Brettanomyces naardenensis]
MGQKYEELDSQHHSFLDSTKDGIELNIVTEPVDVEGSSKSPIALYDTSSLRRIPGNIPAVSYLICFIEFSERLSYYLIQGCITNMIQRRLPHNSTSGAVMDDPANSNESPGALGLGLPIATFLLEFMTLIANLSPLVSGYYSDTRLGKFKTIIIGTIIGVVGHILLVFAALPPVLKVVPLSFAITGISLITVAVSAGFIKPNVMPLLLDQYTMLDDYPTILPNGENAIVDRKATLERMTLIYYLFINVGCFLAFVGSFIERIWGFWVVFLITAVIYAILPILLWFLKPKLRLTQPTGESIFDDVVPLIKQCFSSGWLRRVRYGQFWSYTPVNDTFSHVTMDQLKTTFQSCIIFLYFIIFNVNDSALTPIQINQSGSMKTDGMPNDLFQSFNPLAIIVMIPFQNHALYPLLRWKRIQFTSVDKITVGFALAGIGSIFGAVTQKIIYNTSKCGAYASTCDEVSPISAWWSAIMFSLQAFGECFATVSCYEMAYSRSPENMRSFVLALFLTTYSFSSVIGEFISYFAYDPNLVTIFGWCGGLGVASSVLFYYHFYYLKVEEKE